MLAYMTVVLNKSSQEHYILFINMLNVCNIIYICSQHTVYISLQPDVFKDPRFNSFQGFRWQLHLISDLSGKVCFLFRWQGFQHLLHHLGLMSQNNCGKYLGNMGILLA